MSIKEWTTDSLHTLLGFADSALAGYLIHVASKSGSGEDGVLKTLREGGIAADGEAWRSFAKELVGRCRGNGKKSGGGRVTESEMRKKAKGYALLDMQDEAPSGGTFIEQRADESSLYCFGWRETMLSGVIAALL
jgi:hypothetical protein